MTKKQTERVDERTKGLLMECRKLAQEIALREEGLRELRMRTISSPRLDGMPHSSGSMDASTNKLIQIERREREIQRDKGRLQRLRSAARRVVKPLKPEQCIFYTEYFIEAQKARTARIMAGISERTMTNYLAIIRGAKKETGE